MSTRTPDHLPSPEPKPTRGPTTPPGSIHEPKPLANPRPFNKVFGIGLSRTGTTTLDGALGLLGLRSVHYPSPADMAARNFGFLDAYDAATDISITAHFEELDRYYPNSRFILTIRDLDAWLASIEGHFAVRDQRNYLGDSPAGIIRERTYGRRDFDRDAFIAAFHRHHEHVRRYFAARPADLLVMNITEGDGWEVLCPFLGMAVPGVEWPHLHRRKQAPASTHGAA